MSEGRDDNSAESNLQNMQTIIFTFRVLRLVCERRLKNALQSQSSTSELNCKFEQCRKIQRYKIQNLVREIQQCKKEYSFTTKRVKDKHPQASKPSYLFQANITSRHQWIPLTLQNRKDSFKNGRKVTTLSAKRESKSTASLKWYIHYQVRC